MKQTTLLFKAMPKGLKILWVATIVLLLAWYGHLTYLVFAHKVVNLIQVFLASGWAIIMAFTGLNTLYWRTFVHKE